MKRLGREKKNPPPPQSLLKLRTLPWRIKTDMERGGCVQEKEHRDGRERRSSLKI